ncbi:hypothetical protein GCM10023232_00150 [Sphingosinicella ginsenosidimutans]|uniref:STAS/SEC14 domain-containing protein n=1 Tax=Allosphingosinicella ginsenosidimutans TaxID=1176539 RepID=A0A5C6TUM8_9SPHN|nr:hypothetical protein [Sphingosinicella ginsenosidimutans]TXC63929.1 hypothetical protein FRZ32_09825 [Sphingosinicella ginsenosidimutans]
MSARFTIDVDPARDLVRITMSGFYSAADIDAFLAKRAAAHRLLTCGANEHLTLNDVRGMKIQSQDSVQAFRQMLSDPAYRSRRLAFVVDQTLALFQLERALANRDARCFATVQQAEAWLFERRAGEPAPAAARFGRDAA